MIIEVTGPTGAGKTFYSNELFEELCALGENVVYIHGGDLINEASQKDVSGVPVFVSDVTKHDWKTDLYLLPWLLLFFISYPSCVCWVIGKAFKSPSHKLSVLRSVCRKMGLYQFFRRKRYADQTVLIDEGIIHIAHNLFVSHECVPSKSDIGRFVHLIPFPDRVVMCMGDKENIVEGLKKRGQWSSRVKSEQELMKFVENALTVFEWLIDEDSLQERLVKVSHANQNAEQLIA